MRSMNWKELFRKQDLVSKFNLNSVDIRIKLIFCGRNSRESSMSYTSKSHRPMLSRQSCLFWRPKSLASRDRLRCNVVFRTLRLNLTLKLKQLKIEEINFRIKLMTILTNLLDKMMTTKINKIFCVILNTFKTKLSGWRRRKKKMKNDRKKKNNMKSESLKRKRSMKRERKKERSTRSKKRLESKKGKLD